MNAPLAAPGNGPLSIDEQARTADFVISTGTTDRTGDEMVVAGVDLSEYARNPVVLFGHRQGTPQSVEASMPVGTSVGPDGRLMVWQDRGRLIARCHFHADTQEAREVWEGVRNGWLRGASIGFDPVSEPVPLGNAVQGRRMGFRFDRWKLLEWSIVVIPMNADCVRIRSYLARTPDLTPAYRKALECAADVADEFDWNVKALFREQDHPRAADGRFGTGSGRSKKPASSRPASGGRPKPSGRPAATGGGNRSSVDRSLPPAAQEKMREIGRTLMAADHLEPAQKKAYFDACQGVLSNMSPEAVARFAANVTGPPHFAADLAGVKKELLRRHRGNARVVEQLRAAGEIGGAYAHGGGKASFVLDGGFTRQSGEALRDPTATGIYAHEFSHALDGPRYEISGSKQWREAYAKEIAGGRLTHYAAGKPSEGFAEFGRLVLSGRHDLAAIRAKFPRCFAVWEAHGLVASPGRKADEPAPVVADELFSARVDLDGGHADVLLARAGGKSSVLLALRPLPAVLTRALGRLRDGLSNGRLIMSEILTPAPPPDELKAFPPKKEDDADEGGKEQSPPENNGAAAKRSAGAPDLATLIAQLTTAIVQLQDAVSPKDNPAPEQALPPEEFGDEFAQDEDREPDVEGKRDVTDPRDREDEDEEARRATDRYRRGGRPQRTKGRGYLRKEHHAIIGAAAEHLDDLSQLEAGSKWGPGHGKMCKIHAAAVRKALEESSAADGGALASAEGGTAADPGGGNVGGTVSVSPQIDQATLRSIDAAISKATAGAREAVFRLTGKRVS